MHIDDIDLTDAAVWERGVPYEWFDVLRRDDPVHWHAESDGPGFWTISKYDDLAGEPRRLHSNLINGIKEMPVEFTARASAAV